MYLLIAYIKKFRFIIDSLHFSSKYESKMYLVYLEQWRKMKNEFLYY